MLNKYIFLPYIWERKFRQILECFCADICVSKIAVLCKVSRPCVNRIVQQIRLLIAKECEKISKISGEIEVDESYFGAKRVRGKRGRGAGKKTPVFGMLKRNGCVYTHVVKHCSAKELQSIIKEFSELEESEIYSDGFKSYDGLVDFGAKAHYRVKHSKNEFANGRSHINGIENFWGFAKFRLAKFRGIKRENFVFHLKETEFRYNTKNLGQNLYQILLKLIRENPVKVS